MASLSTPQTSSTTQTSTSSGVKPTVSITGSPSYSSFNLQPFKPNFGGSTPNLITQGGPINPTNVNPNEGTKMLGATYPDAYWGTNVGGGLMPVYSNPVTTKGNTPHPAVMIPQTSSTGILSNGQSSDLSTVSNTLNNLGINNTNPSSSTGSTAKAEEPSYNINASSSDSGAFSGNNTYSDLMKRQMEMMNEYGSAWNQYAQSYGAQQTGGMNDLLREQNALYSGDTTDYGQGLSGMVKNQDILRQAARAIPTQTNLLAAQGLQTQEGMMNSMMGNVIAGAPKVGNVQVTANGDVIGTRTDPTTGAYLPINMGNVYNGTYGGGGVGGDNGATSVSLPQNPDGTYKAPDNGAVNQYFASTISKLPSMLQSYIKSGPGGVAFFDASTAPSWMQTSGMLGQIQALGIPVSSSGQDLTGGIKAATQIYNILGQEQNLIDANLKSGVVGGIEDTLGSIANDIMGGNLNPSLQGFKSLAQSAGKIDTSTMGGTGSGFRMNQAIIDVAINNLPTAGDSVEHAQAKVNALKAIMDAGMQSTFKNYQGTGSLTSTGRTTTSPSISAGMTGNPSVGWF